MMNHEIGDKYRVIFHNSGKMEAYRYGEHWRDLTGDGLVLAMLHEIDDLKDQVRTLGRVAVVNHS
jgi:hypothetical protein